MVMAKSGSMVVLAVMMVLAAAAISLSDAQTVHVVGGEIGWGIPDGSFVTYTTWAATQNFTVGDVLVFNFTTGDQDVAQVTGEAFLLCNSTAPISISKTGPANITLDTAGEHYYLCTFDKHCVAGQRLAINVTEASSPSPSSPPEAPTPKSAPTPASSRSPMNYTVGDIMGWVIPPGGPIVYQTWAYDKNFMVGDTLVFHFLEDLADVAEVTKTAFENCDSNTTIANYTKSPARITLTTSGEHFYVSTFPNFINSTFPNNCQLGQQLAINVTGSSIASPPATPPASSPVTPPASSPSTPPATSPVTPPATSPVTPPATSPVTPPATSPVTPPATPPSITATPPSTTNATPPTSQIAPGTGAPGNDAPSFTAAAGFSATFLSIAVAYLLN